LFSKGGGFNPLDLDPYLLFDARTSMIGTLENPTLDLDPSKQDTLDVITATRAGTATYTDVNGNIASAPANTVRVDQTQGDELTPTKFQNIGYTDFSSGWANYNSTTTTGSGFESQPSRIVEGTVSNSNNYYFPVTTVDSQLYTYSLYVRRVSGTSSVSLVHTNSPTGAKTLINPTSEWQRFSAVFEGVSGGGTSAVGIEESLAGDSVEIAMPQVEEGTTASDFVANTTGSPKFITGATFGPRVPMILVEPSATNLIPYSEDFSQSAWSKNNVTLSSGFSAPDGSMNASKLIANATDSSLQNTFTVASGTTYSVSFYLKTISGSLETAIALGSPGFPQNEGEGGRYKNITVTDEWQRFTLTSTADANASTGISFGGFSSFSTGEEVYIWGAQLETGSVSTSYIPTSGSTVTRAADELVISGSDFSDFFNGSAGTFFIQAQNRTPELNGAVLMGQNSNKLFFYKSNPNRLSTYDGGSFTHHDGLVANQLFNAAVTFNTSNRSSSLDGSALDTDTINTQWAGADILKIGFGYSNNFNGHYRRILFWPYHSDSL
jgi:hypothetical protein